MGWIHEHSNYTGQLSRTPHRRAIAHQQFEFVFVSKQPESCPPKLWESRKKQKKNLHCTKPASNALHRPWVVTISKCTVNKCFELWGVVFCESFQKKKINIKYHLAREKKNTHYYCHVVVGWKRQRWQLEHQLQSSQSKLETQQSGGVERRGVSGVTGSVELNHVESACGENPNTSPLTPGRPVRPTAQTKALTHRPRPVPTFCLFEVEPARPITNWTWGPRWSVGVANIWKH